MINNNDHRVLDAVATLTRNRMENAEEAFIWISTREIAEYCDITIYRARYSLLKLEKNGDIVHKPTGKKMTLSWRLAKKPAG